MRIVNESNHLSVRRRAATSVVSSLISNGTLYVVLPLRSEVAVVDDGAAAAAETLGGRGPGANSCCMLLSRCSRSSICTTAVSMTASRSKMVSISYSPCARSVKLYTILRDLREERE